MFARRFNFDIETTKYIPRKERSLVQFGPLGLIVTAVISGSLGFLIGGVVASGKVEDLHTRLSITENALERQSKFMTDLESLLRSFVAEVEAGGKLDPDGRSMVIAKALLP